MKGFDPALKRTLILILKETELDENEAALLFVLGMKNHILSQTEQLL